MKSLLGKLVVILFGFVIFGYAEVWGADWKLFYFSEKSFDYYDADGIIRSSRSIVKVWVKRVYTKEGVIDVVQKLGKHFEKVKYEIHLLEINCPDKKQRFLHSVSYSEGEAIYSYSYDKRTDEWDFIVPESVGEILYGVVCK